MVRSLRLKWSPASRSSSGNLGVEGFPHLSNIDQACQPGPLHLVPYRRSNVFAKSGFAILSLRKIIANSKEPCNFSLKSGHRKGRPYWGSTDTESQC
jgi:hypothetical protein